MISALKLFPKTDSGLSNGGNYFHNIDMYNISKMVCCMCVSCIGWVVGPSLMSPFFAETITRVAIRLLALARVPVTTETLAKAKEEKRKKVALVHVPVFTETLTKAEQEERSKKRSPSLVSPFPQRLSQRKEMILARVPVTTETLAKAEQEKRRN